MKNSAFDCFAGSSVQLIKVTCFWKLSADQLLVLIDRMAQVRNEKAM